MTARYQKHCMRAKNARLKKTKREMTMNYRDTYMDFEWKRIEGEGVSVAETPLDSLIRKENMSQLARSLSKLDQTELACILLMHFDETSKNASQIRNYVNSLGSDDFSKYKICKFEKSGLKKIRSELRNVFGWER